MQIFSKEPKTLTIILLIACALSTTTCGPSSKEKEIIAQALTATAATDTPTPTNPPTTTPTPTITTTPTVTPHPYDLKIRIVDDQNTPITWAEVYEKETVEARFVDEAGELIWEQISTDSLELRIEAQGYYPQEVRVSVPGEQEIPLNRDPYGLSPMQACRPDETWLYIEDFQDGQAEGWENISSALYFNENRGWYIQTEGTRNLILSATRAQEDLIDELKFHNFKDGVLRIKVKAIGQDNNMYLKWRFSISEGNEQAYLLDLLGNYLVRVLRYRSLQGEKRTMGTINNQMPQNKWVHFELATHGGDIQLWMDGKQLLSFTDSEPLPAGKLSLEVHTNEKTKAVFRFDDIAICDFTPPFQSIYSGD